MLASDADPLVVKLMGYYGHFITSVDIGNVTSGAPLYFGTNVDPNFSASRLFVPFHSISGDAIPPERPQADKITSLIGKDIKGTYQIVAGDWSVEEDVGTMKEFFIEALCKSLYWNYRVRIANSIAT